MSLRLFKLKQFLTSIPYILGYHYERILEMITFLFLLQVIVTAILVITGIICLSVGINKSRGSDRSAWYKHPYVLMGFLALLLALILAFETVRVVTISPGNVAINTVFFVIEGILLVCAIISAFFAWRYFPFAKRKNTNV
jgi:hypothetical protein